MPSSYLSGYGYNFINTGTHDPAELYNNGIGTVTFGTYSRSEYQYFEDDDGVILAKCNATSYSGDSLNVGGNISITKTVNNVATTYSKSIKKLGAYLYYGATINVSNINIGSTIRDIDEYAFGGASKTCATLELENSGTVKTNAFSNLSVTNNLSIYNLTALETNSLPNVNGINIKIFKTGDTIVSSDAFGTSANTSNLQVPAAKLAEYAASAWNQIPVANISSYESYFTTTDGGATVTYYYKEVGTGLDIVYAKSASQLTTVHIPATATISSVTKNIDILESSALGGLGSITGVELPATLKAYIFNKDYEPSTLTTYTLAGSSSYYSAVDGVLFNASGSKLISYPKGKSDTSYTVGSGVTTIASGAFQDNTNLTSVTIAPSTSVTILDNAFKGCSGLSSLTVTGNVVLGDYALANTSLTNVTITGTSTIGAYAFKDSDSLQNVNFQNKATIESYAFADSNENINLNFTGSTVSEFAGRNIFSGVAAYNIYVPSGTLSSYYENVLYDMSILSHIKEVSA